jgi:sulfate/thiosulfate transport system substrate-binding protein
MLSALQAVVAKIEEFLYQNGVGPMLIRLPKPTVFASAALLLAAFALAGCKPSAAPAPNAKGSNGGASLEPPVQLLNVSYDPTREFYKDYNVAFKEHWKEKNSQDVEITQSHGGSGGQAKAVISGIAAADVVTLALAYDVDAIHQNGDLLPENWQSRLKNNSAPYTSTIVFLVRKGNPKGIHDWDDLLKPDVEIITPDPKTSGGARWNYLAAWGYALKKELKDLKKLQDPSAADEVARAQDKAKEFVASMFTHIKGMASGARGATMSFTRDGQGDVLLAWENEAFFSLKESGEDKYEIVAPSISILAEPTVAVVDANVKKHNTEKVAQEYLDYLYKPVGQALAAKHNYRPRDFEGVAPEDKKKFKDIELFTIDDVFGGWQKAQSTHFNDKGVYDQIMKAKVK